MRQQSKFHLRYMQTIEEQNKASSVKAENTYKQDIVNDVKEKIKSYENTKVEIIKKNVTQGNRCKSMLAENGRVASRMEELLKQFAKDLRFEKNAINKNIGAVEVLPEIEECIRKVLESQKNFIGSGFYNLMDFSYYMRRL